MKKADPAFEVGLEHEVIGASRSVSRVLYGRSRSCDVATIHLRPALLPA